MNPENYELFENALKHTYCLDTILELWNKMWIHVYIIIEF